MKERDKRVRERKKERERGKEIVYDKGRKRERELNSNFQIFDFSQTFATS